MIRGIILGAFMLLIGGMWALSQEPQITKLIQSRIRLSNCRIECLNPIPTLNHKLNQTLIKIIKKDKFNPLKLFILVVKI
jgi:hypothetical protein